MIKYIKQNKTKQIKIYSKQWEKVQRGVPYQHIPFNAFKKLMNLKSWKKCQKVRVSRYAKFPWSPNNDLNHNGNLKSKYN